MLPASAKLAHYHLAELIENPELPFVDAYGFGLRALSEIDAPECVLLLEGARQAIARYDAEVKVYLAALAQPSDDGPDTTTPTSAALDWLNAIEETYRRTAERLISQVVAIHDQIRRTLASSQSNRWRIIYTALDGLLHRHIAATPAELNQERIRVISILLDRGDALAAWGAVEHWVRETPPSVPLLELLGHIATRLDRAEEAVAIFATTTKAHPNLGLYRSPNFAILQRECQRRNLPSILLNTQFKSGSLYLRYNLERGLRLPYIFLRAWNMEQPLAPSALRDFAAGGAVCQEHLSADRALFQTLLDSGVDRFVLHIRDPRQIVVSAVHHYTNQLSRVDLQTKCMYAHILPRDYQTWSFERRVDDFLETGADGIGDWPHRRLAWEIRWLEEWADFLASGERKPRVLLSRHNDLQGGTFAVINRILAFYEIDSGSVDYAVMTDRPKPGDMHFRSGNPKEWQTVLTPDQINRIEAMIPPKVRRLVEGRA